MAKSKKAEKKPSYEKEYAKIMSQFPIIPNAPQVISPHDMFIKFSLYTYSQSTITSTNTTSSL